MKAIHNKYVICWSSESVVLYPKDTEKWKQFTTNLGIRNFLTELCCIPKIQKNESNSQRRAKWRWFLYCCVVSQRYWKMKAIHNLRSSQVWAFLVVLYPKDTEKWKQFTTSFLTIQMNIMLCCIPKILKNESNSQPSSILILLLISCVVSQRYWKMKAIHNGEPCGVYDKKVVLYPKDTEKWKQFTTFKRHCYWVRTLCCIPKILKNESNSQQPKFPYWQIDRCVVSQRYWKMKAINKFSEIDKITYLSVLYPFL